MKKLYNGQEVTEETPTKLINGKRFLFEGSELEDYKNLQKQDNEIVRKAKLKARVRELKAEITVERLSEAIVSDKAWLKNQLALIEEQETKLENI